MKKMIRYDICSFENCIPNHTTWGKSVEIINKIIIEKVPEKFQKFVTISFKECEEECLSVFLEGEREETDEEEQKRLKKEMLLEEKRLRLAVAQEQRRLKEIEREEMNALKTQEVEQSILNKLIKKYGVPK